MHSETYVASGAYGVLVRRIALILRRGKRSIFNPRPIDAEELRMQIVGTLGNFGERAALVDALAGLEVDPFTGDFEPCQVKLTLGEEGGIWPEHVRPALSVAA